MSATRILWGQIAAVLALTLAGIQAGTQWTAHALGFQSQLGAPMFLLADTPVYPPWAIFWWWFSYEAYAPRIFETGGMIAASGGLLSVVVAIAMSVWRARGPQQRHLWFGALGNAIRDCQGWASGNQGCRDRTAGPPLPAP